ncbi:TIGR03619 family F420-dependent LLM class oxidoreductase [Pseudonocardia sp. HH130629-09]|uniref:TIGR03619 family F420-dependent LLM class oxidoreductase n=1 Tax=Pseudonocardia sp. HH130629-09 TaxID=1641402 RepID=UPI001930E63B|nr:TIGR03619 family F420-dependent LLM class oxidoreductase [Pseudonocardia sp. HH130629-09]
MRFAASAEEHGAESLWVGDRLLAPVSPTVNLGNLDHIPAIMRASHDPLTLLGVAAAVTTRVLLGTSTINAPWYPPPLLARQALTLDQVSGGRLVLGLGVGWSPDEYAAVGVPWEERGARLDECLDVLAAWWHDDPVEHAGRTGTIMPSYVQVKPHGIPIYLGGWGRRPMQRAAERADGFLPVLLPDTVDQLDAVVNRPWQRLRDAAVAAGRPADAIGAALRYNVAADDDPAHIGGVLRRVTAETDVADVFVDFMEKDPVGDEAVDLAARVLDAARDGSRHGRR